MVGPRHISLYPRLLLLIGVALFPVVVLAISGLVVLGHQQRTLVQQGLVERARAIASAVDLELFSSVAALQTLALSENLGDGDLRRFHQQSKAAVGARSGWEGIILIDPAGNRLLNTRVPYGAPIPGGAAVVERTSFETLLASGEPSIGSLAKGPGGNYRYPIRVPVMRAGKLRYVLTVFVKPDAMRNILEHQRVVDESLITIFDSNLTIVARSRAHESSLGNPVSETLRALIGGVDEGVGVTNTREGDRVYTAYVRSPRSQWGIALGAAKNVVDWPVRRSYTLSAAGILLSIALAVVLSAFLARRISAPIAQLRASAQALGRGDVPPLPHASIPEVDDVAHALTSAAAEIRAKTDELKLLNATLETRVVSRTRDLHRANIRLKAANKELEAYSYSISHDLRAPLRAIDGYANILLLEHASQLDEEGRRCLDVVQANAKRMGDLINDLLEFARLARQPMARQRVDMQALVNECVAVLHEEYKSVPAEYLVHDMPSVEGDPALLRQVWMNLIGNACKYTSKTDGARIEIGCQKHRGEDIFYVRDNGVGFDMKYANKLFGVFQRLHGADEFEGTGVGLALVQRIVHRHGGNVWATSEPEHGATFFFTLGEPEREATGTG